MKNRITKIRNHVTHHRFKYGVATGITIAGYFAVKRAQEWNEFLIEEGVYDKFYETAE